MGNRTSVSESITIDIVDTLPANTPLEPLSEDGFVWLLVNRVQIPNAINADIPVWIKLSIFLSISLPVYNQNGLVTVQVPIDPNGSLIGVYKSDSGTSTVIEEAFNSISVNNNFVSIVAAGVLPPAGKNTQDAYLQHSTLAPQVPQVSSHDLLAEIIQRQANPKDSRKLPDNVTITVGQQTVVNTNVTCVKKYSNEKYCKKCKCKH